MSDIRIEARRRAGLTELRLLIRHPMETGQGRDPLSGALIPAHYIVRLEVDCAGRALLRADTGTGVARNPYLALRFKGGEAGDTLAVRWLDNLGGEGAAQATIVAAD